MRRHTADVQARRQDGGAGRALRHLGDPVGKFFPLKILAGILYFPVPGVEKKKKLPVPRVTEISTVHLFISNLTRAVWGLPYLTRMVRFCLRIMYLDTKFSTRVVTRVYNQ